MTKYAKYGVYALPLAVVGAWFLHFPAGVGIPLALVGVASVVLLYLQHQAAQDAAAKGGTGGSGGGGKPPKPR